MVKLPFSAEVKNEWSYICIPLYASMAWSGINLLFFIGVCFGGVKQPGCEADYAILFGVKVKNIWRCTAFPHIFSWRSV
jgi:hypothetical protein